MSLLGGIGSDIGGLFSANAANHAGQLISQAGTSASNAIGTAGNQAAAATNAATNTGVTGINNAVTGGQAGVNAATGTANNTANQLLGNQLNNLNPYQQLGTQGAATQSALMSGNPATESAAVQATPGYQFQLQQGLQGVEQQLGASGGAATGGALKALTQYGQGLASNYYQQAFNNANTMTQTDLQGTGMANQATQNAGNLLNSNTMGSAYYNGTMGLQGAQSAGQMGQTGHLSVQRRTMSLGTILNHKYFAPANNAPHFWDINHIPKKMYGNNCSRTSGDDRIQLIQVDQTCRIINIAKNRTSTCHTYCTYCGYRTICNCNNIIS